MKHRPQKNIFISVGAYLVALIWYVGWAYAGSKYSSRPKPPEIVRLLDLFVVIPMFTAVIVRVFFAARSGKQKKSTWL
jgi:arginine exporter protein ArgO